MIDKPKKERRFLKNLGKIGEILLQEVLIKIGSSLIKRIGGKKTLPSILFLFLSVCLFAQYPATGNKQRLGYQTTGDGLVFRGRASDTVAIKSSGLNNAYFILDTLNNILYNYIKTKGGWKFTNTDSVVINNTVDTTSLSNRINLKVNISDTASMLLPYLRKADTASMLTPYFRDSDTTSLNLTSRFATKLNISDTSSMLTNYLRTGVAASTYLTQSSAASTYLPLAGGTITGTINRADQFNDGSPLTAYYNILNYFARRDNVKGNQTAQITFTDRPGTYTFENNVRTSDIYLMTAKNWNGSALGQFLDTTLSIVANQDGGRIGISKLNPAYKLDVNGTFNASGNSLIGGTLGVNSNLNVTGQSTLLNKVFVGNFTDNTPTSGDNYNVRLESNDVSSIGFHDAGNTIANIKFSAATGFVIGASDGLYGPHSTTMAGATTLTGALTVNNATVLNEGSGDFDTRIESDGNANMVFVDASTDRVGIGTGSPSKTLDVNGEVKIATVTATPTSLLGKDASNVVGEVTTVAQTGLMTRGETLATTGSPSAIFTVTHGLGSNPSAVIVTSAGIGGGDKIIFEVYTKSSTTFSVQAWNLDGTEASSKSVKIYWLAIK